MPDPISPDSPLSHQPVLPAEVVQLLAPSGGKVIVDCTVGLGGHAARLLDALGPGARLIGIDVDEGNLVEARRRLARFGRRVRLFRANFTELPTVMDQAGEATADVILADLGVSSSQLGDPSRGLSFSVDGPLDMRLDLSITTTAADLVNATGQKQLADLIYAFGQERYSRRIAAAIVAARRHKPIETTRQLEQIVFSAMPAPVRRTRRGVHPATRTFQALRIAVNGELENLDRLLELLLGFLGDGGRAAIISFHSLEDRRVKRAFAAWAADGAAKVLTKKPITPSPDEVATNPASRSAKLRAIEKLIINT